MLIKTEKDVEVEIIKQKNVISKHRKNLIEDGLLNSCVEKYLLRIERQLLKIEKRWLIEQLISFHKNCKPARGWPCTGVGGVYQVLTVAKHVQITTGANTEKSVWNLKMVAK